MHFPFLPPTPSLATAPNPSKKSQQNNALCLFPTRGQRILLYQHEQINKVCGTERLLIILGQRIPGRECPPGGGPGHGTQLCDTGPEVTLGVVQLCEPLAPEQLAALPVGSRAPRRVLLLGIQDDCGNTEKQMRSRPI